MATYRVLTGTWYEIQVPEDKIDQPGYSPEELYSSYFNEGVPDDVEFDEIECDHVWEDELK